MKHIVVLGGSGYLGSRVVTSLRALTDVQVKVASRRGELRFDLTRPETFEALAGADLVIDLTDATSTPPDAAVAWCLERGLTVIEATSDAPCVERLYSRHQQRQTGQLVLGGGIFTGVSNLLARAATERVGLASALTLGVATSPFSGAGTGTIALMVKALGVPSVRFIDHVRHDVQALEAGPRLAFGRHTRDTVRTSLAEPFMMHQSLGVPNVDAYLAPKPGLLATLFLLTPAFFFTSALGQSLMRAYFTVLRGVLLRSVPTAVELVALAQSPTSEARVSIGTRDGMTAGAWALAAMAEQLLATPPAAGVWFIDQLTQLNPIVSRANALAQATVFETV